MARSHAIAGCPGDLDSTSQARWRAVRKHLLDEGRWQDIYAPTVTRYVRALALADAALDDLRDEYGAFDLTARGSQGEGHRVQHPSWKSYCDACRIADAAAASLLLTPAARSKMGERANAGPKADDDPFA